MQLNKEQSLEFMNQTLQYMDYLQDDGTMYKQAGKSPLILDTIRSFIAQKPLAALGAGAGIAGVTGAAIGNSKGKALGRKQGLYVGHNKAMQKAQQAFGKIQHNNDSVWNRIVNVFNSDRLYQ